MLDGVLYAPNAVGLIEAFDAGSGKTLWVQEPATRRWLRLAGQSTRGVDVLGEAASSGSPYHAGDYPLRARREDRTNVPDFGD